MDNFEVLISEENNLKEISILLDKEKIFDFVFDVKENYQNSMMTIRFYDNKGHEHYTVKEICIVRNEYMAYSFIEDLTYAISDLLEKFKHKDYGNYPEDILTKWAKCMDMFSRMSHLQEGNLPKEKLFKGIFTDFLLGKITDEVSFNYLLFDGKNYVMFNSLNMNSLFYIRYKENDSFTLLYDNFHFEFNFEKSFDELIKAFATKDALVSKKVLNEMIVKAVKNESKSIFVNELLLEL